MPKQTALRSPGSIQSTKSDLSVHLPEYPGITWNLSAIYEDGLIKFNCSVDDDDNVFSQFIPLGLMPYLEIIANRLKQNELCLGFSSSRDPR